MANAKSTIKRSTVLWSILTSQVYLGLAVVGALVYFLIFSYMIRYSNYGVFLVTVPIYLIYIMVATAGILLSMTIYSVARALLKPATELEEGALSVILPSIGGLMATCACSYSLLGVLLIYFGVSSLAVSGVMATVSAYQVWIIVAIIAANLLLIYYYSGKIVTAECKIELKNSRSRR